MLENVPGGLNNIGDQNFEWKRRNEVGQGKHVLLFSKQNTILAYLIEKFSWNDFC
jgi:hypothetical protein